MQESTFLLSALTVAICMMPGANVSVAAEQETQASTQKPEVVYGSQLMTREERAEYRARMRSMKTREEREAFRMEHHQKMQERAKAQGKTLPDMPPGGGMMKPCSGPGPCGGMGPGGGGMRQQGGGAASEGGY